VEQAECEKLLDGLKLQIQKTLSSGGINPQMVIDACDKLAKSINNPFYLDSLIQMGIPTNLAREYLIEAEKKLSREFLEHKLRRELGEYFCKTKEYIPPFQQKAVVEKMAPLGVLFHITAGNVDALPAMSAIEGLLVGNINILKLPQEEGGISARILMELFKIEPALAEYVYVFDFSSKDVTAMTKLAGLADAVVVWGGDNAVQAIRQMAPLNTKIIEWGHKLSFAYITKEGITDEKLIELAQNICETNQLLCNSCQGIFIDTNEMEDVYHFSERFLPILEKTSENYHREVGIGIQSQVTFQLYNNSLESLFSDFKIYRSENCSITANSDMKIESSIKFRNCWVKRLPRQKLLETLRPYKNHLQTVALICSETEKEDLVEKFWKTGVVRVTNGSNMSSMYAGAAHDGEYPLRRYTKIVSVE
jgi:hypothetical protein